MLSSAFAMPGIAPSDLYVNICIKYVIYVVFNSC